MCKPYNLPRLQCLTVLRICAGRVCVTTSSSETASAKWRGIALLLLGVIFLNMGIFAYIYLGLQTDFDAVHSQFVDLQLQLVETQQGLQGLQQKLAIIQYVNQSESLLIPKIFDLVKDSVVLIKTKMQTITGLQDLAQGSGFVYDRFGHIVTNNHVIEDADEISVTFTSGNSSTATLVGADPYSDIAVIQVSAEAVSPVVLGNSSALLVGEAVVAIGNPFGLSGTVTAGIVSQVGRALSAPGGYRIVDVIQLDAAINPGNSGGPLVNMWGEVVGMNTAIVSGATGVGFAIPSDTIRRELSALLAAGHYSHPWIGIQGYDVDPALAASIGLNYTDGVFVSEVVVGGPAAAAGMRGNDVIVGLNEVRIRDFNSLSLYLERHTRPGDTVTVTLIRSQQQLHLQVVIGDRPPP
jgi:S1-C subfamily serine protease